jgi:hypothetical protein
VAIRPDGSSRSSSSSASSSHEGSRRSSISWSRPSQLNGLQLELHQQPQESRPQPVGISTPPSPPAGNGFSLFSGSPSGGGSSQSHSASSSENGGQSSTAQSTPRSAQPSSSPAHAPIVNEVVCGSLMLAYERAGKWAEAVNVLNRAKAIGVQPNAVMYNTAISAAGKAGQLALAQSLFNSAAARDVVTYETLVAAYGIAGMPDQVCDLCALRPCNACACPVSTQHAHHVLLTTALHTAHTSAGRADLQPDDGAGHAAQRLHLLLHGCSVQPGR